MTLPHEVHIWRHLAQMIEHGSQTLLHLIRDTTTKRLQMFELELHHTLKIVLAWQSRRLGISTLRKSVGEDWCIVPTISAQMGNGSSC